MTKLYFAHTEQIIIGNCIDFRYGYRFYFCSDAMILFTPRYKHEIPFMLFKSISGSFNI